MPPKRTKGLEAALQQIYYAATGDDEVYAETIATLQAVLMVYYESILQAASARVNPTGKIDKDTIMNLMSCDPNLKEEVERLLAINKDRKDI